MAEGWGREIERGRERKVGLAKRGTRKGIEELDSGREEREEKDEETHTKRGISHILFIIRTYR